MTGTIKAIFTGLGAALHGYGLFKTASAVSVALRDVLRVEAQVLTIHNEINEWNRKKDRVDPEEHAVHLASLHRWLQRWEERAASCDQRLQRAEH